MLRLDKTIMVWRFCDAPREYQNLTTPCDKDWVAFIPDALKDNYIGWTECNHFGRCDVDEYEVNGGIVRIGCHA